MERALDKAAITGNAHALFPKIKFHVAILCLCVGAGSLIARPFMGLFSSSAVLFFFPSTEILAVFFDLYVLGSGFAILLLKKKPHPNWVGLLIRFCSSLLVTLGIISIAAYITSSILATGYPWFARLWLPTSVGICLAGIGFFSFGWYCSTQRDSPPWLPLMAGICLFTLSYVFWQTLDARSKKQAVRQTGETVYFFKHDTESSFIRITTALERMAGHWGAASGTQPSQWRGDARFYIEAFRGLDVVAFVDRGLIVQMVEPNEDFADLIGKRSASIPVWTEEYDSFNMLIPVYEGITFEGFMLGHIDLADFVAPIITEISGAFAVRLMEADTVIFESEKWVERVDAFTQTGEIVLKDLKTWTVLIAPLDKYFDSDKRIEKALLIIGASISLIASLAIYFARKASIDSRLLRLHQEGLEDIVKERTSQLEQSISEKEVLIRELYHRTKNNMQVIGSMIELQAAQIGDRKAISIMQSLRDRIGAMSLVHEKLYQSQDLSSINFDEYIIQLVDLLMSSHQSQAGRVNIDCRLQPLQMLLDIALPCGLVINELLTNSLKHAFPEGREGAIVIRLSLIDDAQIMLQVSDNGVGVPDNFDPDSSNSFGLAMVKTITEHQLNGRCAFDHENGFVCTLIFEKNLYKQRV